MERRTPSNGVDYMAPETAFRVALAAAKNHHDLTYTGEFTEVVESGSRQVSMEFTLVPGTGCQRVEHSPDAGRILLRLVDGDLYVRADAQALEVFFGIGARRVAVLAGHWVRTDPVGAAADPCSLEEVALPAAEEWPTFIAAGSNQVGDTRTALFRGNADSAAAFVDVATEGDPLLIRYERRTGFHPQVIALDGVDTGTTLKRPAGHVIDVRRNRSA